MMGNFRRTITSGDRLGPDPSRCVSRRHRLVGELRFAGDPSACFCSFRLPFLQAEAGQLVLE
jgi:hypothetical protein